MLIGLNRNLAVFGLVHALIFCLLAIPGLFFFPAPGLLERDIALRVISGQVPYKDFAIEYPPLALVSFILPAIFFKGAISYYFAFVAEMLVLDLITLFLIYRLSIKLDLAPWRLLTAYTIFVVAIGPFLTNRYDLFPAMLTLAALTAFGAGRNKTAWAVLAMGVAAKLYPVILAPLFGLYQLRYRQYSNLFKGVISFLLVILVTTLPWLIISPSGLWYSLNYHLARGLHSESTYGTALLVGQLLGLTRVSGELTYGSWNLASPLADSLAKISTYVLIGSLLVIYGFFARSIWKKPDVENNPFSKENIFLIFQYASLTILAFLLTNKVFSAQYLIWLLPLLPLVKGRWKLNIWGLFVACGIITQYIFPYAYGAFEAAQPIPVIFMAVRNLLLVLMFILMVLTINRQGETLLSK